MLKKYSPYIVLLVAALLLFFVKRNQKVNTQQQPAKITTHAVRDNYGLNRFPDSIIYTRHARCRMDCRHITEQEVKEILENGKVNSNKIEEDRRGKTYPLEGKTKADDRMLRIVVAPKRNNIVVVTVIDLDKDWPCGDCK